MQYLKRRANLKRVFLLIDSRRGVRDTDRKIMDIFDDCAVNYQLVLTKCDKNSVSEIEKIKQTVISEMPFHTALHPNIIETSSHKKHGLDSLRQEIINFVN